MKIGTKSILFGAHLWWLHPWFVAAAWTKLYGFPIDWRLWFCFFVHDLGYWGKPNLDGPEGESHVEWGAHLANIWCDKLLDDEQEWVPYTHVCEMEQKGWRLACHGINPSDDCILMERGRRDTVWHDFCLYHSRFYSKRDGKHFSRLCVADKLAICLEPYWLYLPRVILTGEIHEYMGLAEKRGKDDQKYTGMNLSTQSRRQWFESMVTYLRAWVAEHKDMKPDTWTPEVSNVIN